MKIILVAIAVLVGLNIGNYNGDQATLRDCATKGSATMKGGGTIECKVKKEK